MPDLSDVGRILLILGIGIALIGGLLMLGSRIPWLGNLPGDIRIEREGFSCFFPLATSILLSLLLTVILNLILRLRQ
jgi:hypothetical protein